MLKDHYDIIIVGAGPAGLACALELKRRGAEDFVVLERFTFPRDKCCAGYITGKTKQAYKAFGLDVEECHYSFIEDFGIHFKGKERQKIQNRFLYTNRGIDRVELDYAFFKLAREKGVPIEENCRVSGIDAKAGTIEVCVSGRNAADDISADGTTDGIAADGRPTNGSAGEVTKTVGFGKLVLADGTMGLGCKLQEPMKRNIAMQLIFQSGRPDSIELHFGIAPKGYGWISSYGGLTNIGLTDEFRKDANYQELFASFMKGAGYDPDALIKEGSIHAAFTPIGVKEPILNDRVYFAGDALGACDPFTLSGLRYGLKSGQTAAESIVNSDPELYRKYARGLRGRFRFSRFLMKLFYTRPVLFLVFRVGCGAFSGLIALVFNRYFVNKK